MDKDISCAFNIDTACVEVKYASGSMISFDCTLVEAEVARILYEASELDWLVSQGRRPKDSPACISEFPRQSYHHDSRKELQ